VQETESLLRRVSFLNSLYTFILSFVYPFLDTCAKMQTMKALVATQYFLSRLPE